MNTRPSLIKRNFFDKAARSTPKRVHFSHHKGYAPKAQPSQSGWDVVLFTEKNGRPLVKMLHGSYGSRQ